MALMKKHRLEEFIEKLIKEGLFLEAECFGKEKEEILYLTYNSKEAAENTLFICKGAAFKEDYLEEALKQGALGYISEKRYESCGEVPYILVTDIRKAMPILADMFFNSAWEDINVIGIGGTKGKSTSVYYMKAIVDDYLEAQGKRDSAVISSIDIYDGVVSKESHITTPEAVELQGHIRNAVESGMEFLQMEVSSQALKYGRVDNMKFDVAAFLNISEDHISPIEHADFEDYFRSKLLIFEKTKTAVVNLDADFLDRILEAAKAAEKVVTFSTRSSDADFYAYNIHKEGNGTVFMVKCAEFEDRILEAAKAAEKVVTFSTRSSDADFYAYNIHKEGNGTVFMVKCAEFDKEFVLTMPGLFNVENALAVIAIASQFQIPVEYMYSGLKRARSSGRMELYTSQDNKVIAVVDYAHNKLSFEKLFSSTKEEYPNYDIISIFGCPGKKAFIRRRDLGTIAGKYAKKVYLAAEDPGYEPVEEISRDIAQYVEKEGCPYEMIEDRGEAIKKAIESVERPSILLITGKGNETRQKYGCEYIDCPSDVDYVKKYLAEYDERNQ